MVGGRGRRTATRTKVHLAADTVGRTKGSASLFRLLRLQFHFSFDLPIPTLRSHPHPWEMLVVMAGETWNSSSRHRFRQLCTLKEEGGAIFSRLSMQMRVNRSNRWNEERVPLPLPSLLTVANFVQPSNWIYTVKWNWSLRASTRFANASPMEVHARKRRQCPLLLNRFYYRNNNCFSSLFSITRKGYNLVSQSWIKCIGEEQLPVE